MRMTGPKNVEEKPSAKNPAISNAFQSSGLATLVSMTGEDAAAERDGLETFKPPLDEVLVFGLVVFGTDISLCTVDIKGPELALAGFLSVNGIDETLG